MTANPTTTVVIAQNVIQVVTIGIQGPAGPAGDQGPQGEPGAGVPVGGTAGQVLAKINSTNYNTQWVDQSGGGGGGFIQNQYEVPSGDAHEVLLSSGNIMVLWNSADAAAKTETIPVSSGSLQIIMLVDYYGNSATYPINIVDADANPIADILTDGNTLTLMDSILGWIVQ